MKLLLHICCAPCLIYPLETLSKENFGNITGFFYNPNIHPYAEYLNRRASVEEFSRRKGLKVFFHKYDMKNFFRHVAGNEEPGKRCAICWRERLGEAAYFAAHNGFTHFSTTLLVSPYQDQGAIKAIGEGLAAEFNIGFLYRDFTPGFAGAQIKSKEENMYRQRYCGCLYSEQERFEKGRAKKKKPKAKIVR
jgi:hypothetical protein